MQKLIIQDIAQINADWYAIRFSGPERLQHTMNVFLAQQTKENAYWDETGLHGKGAWIICLDLFKRLGRDQQDTADRTARGDSQAADSPVIVAVQFN